MAKKFGCKRCYETDDLGQITEFKCSRYGWDGTGVPCTCHHHDGDVSLYGRGIVDAVAKEMAA